MKKQQQNKMRLVRQGLRFTTLLLLLLANNSTYAQNWKPVGSDDKYRATYAYASGDNNRDGALTMAVDANGTPYIAFVDQINGSKLSVKKFNGTSWVNVGVPGFTAEQPNYTKIKIDAQGNPWVVYSGFNTKIGYPAFVVKFNGTSWVNIGDTAASPGTAYSPSLAFDANHTPYVVYESGNTGKAVVRKFNGTKWEDVGQVLSTTLSNSSNQGTDIAFDKYNNPYITYIGVNGQLACKRYDGYNWGFVGGVNVCSYSAYFGSLAIDKNGTPYVFYAYYDRNSYKTTGTVKKFDGTNWVAVGDTAFTPTSNNFSNIALDTTGVPYIGISEFRPNSFGQASLMKFDGSNWAYAGSRAFGAIGSVLSLAISPAGNVFLAGASGELGGIGVVYSYNGTTYKMLGNGGITGHFTKSMKMIADPNGTPYIVFVNGQHGYKVNLIKYNGTQWLNVGGDISDSSSSYIDVAFNKSGTPYVVYSDEGDSNKLTVKKYNGSSWVTVGSANFSTRSSSYCSISVAPDGTPFVAFKDQINNLSATVVKYNGSGWVTVGNSGFTSKEVWFTNIQFDPFGNPYLTFTDNNFRGNVSVAKYDGNSWNLLGGRAIPGSNIGFTVSNSLAFDQSGVPYILTGDTANSNRATARKFNGTSWVTIGSPGFTGGYIVDHQILIDKNGTPYISFVEPDSGWRINVMKYVNGSWTFVGSPNFNAGYADNVSMALGKNGVIYAAYSYGALYAFQYQTAASNLTLSAGTGNNIKAAWHGLKNHTYRLYYKAQTAQGLYTLVQVKDTQYTITNTVAGTTYIAYVTDSAQANFSNTATYSTPASSGCSMAAPGALTHTVTAGSASLSWTASASKYLIYYKKVTDGWWVIDSTSSTSYSLKGVGPSTCYVAFITNKCGTTTGYSSAIDSFCTPGICAAPSNLVLTTPACNGFTATWTAVTGATSYSVYYSYSGTSFSKPLTTTSLSVSNVPKSTNVTAYVVARGCNGNSTINSLPSTLQTISTLGATVGCKEGEDGKLLSGANASSISVYPNPSNGQFTVDMNTNNTVDNATVEVINLLGQVISQTIAPNSNGIIHTTLNNNLANGVYMVRLTMGTESHLSRIVIQK